MLDQTQQYFIGFTNNQYGLDICILDKSESEQPVRNKFSIDSIEGSQVKVIETPETIFIIMLINYQDMDDQYLFLITVSQVELEFTIAGNQSLRQASTQIHG
jgi:hypothetical protein